MRTVSCCFITILVTASPATLLIYLLKFLSLFNSLGIYFLAFGSDHHCETKLVLKLGVLYLDTEGA